MPEKSKLVQKQFLEFIYNQLIDAFVYFETPKAINWLKISSPENKIKKLAAGFVIRDMNEALIKQYGGSRETISGLTLHSFFGKKFWNNEESWTNLIHNESVFSELCLDISDGTELWVEGYYQFVKNDAGRTIGILGMQRDITRRTALEDLKKAKIAAEEANQAKSEFLANISHEIRTPLNSVLGFTELLERLTQDPIQIKYLNSIKASGKNLMMLINDLLDLSKIEAGKMTLHFEFFDMRRLLDEIRNIFSLRVVIKGIEYSDTLDGNFPAEIKFDEVRLRQILINLIGNSVKFTHEGEIRIDIRAHPKKEKSKPKEMRLEIDVLDTGIGIPEDSFRLIFESFRQHSQLNSRKYGGTGLGLAITKRLVEAMNGTISLESTIGKGTKFSLSFPGIEYNEIPPDTYASRLLHHDLHIKRDSAPGVEQKEKNDEFMINEMFGRSSIKNSDYQIVLKKFNQDLTDQWKLFETRQPLKDIQFFAQEIVNLGTNFNLGFIQEYGEQLLTTIENFDIEEMRLKLDYFPDLVKHLKKIGHET